MVLHVSQYRISFHVNNETTVKRCTSSFQPSLKPEMFTNRKQTHTNAHSVSHMQLLLSL